MTLKGRKRFGNVLGKEKKYGLPPYSPFPKMFSAGIFQGHQNTGLFGKELTGTNGHGISESSVETQKSDAGVKMHLNLDHTI